MERGRQRRVKEGLEEERERRERGEGRERERERERVNPRCIICSMK